MQYPNIAQPQYGFGPTMPPGMYDTPPAMMNFKDGGMTSSAQKVQSQGRGDDTMLVHMTPKEVAGLQALAMAHGGSLTINPKTGLPEAGFLKNLLPTLLGVGLSFIPGVGPMAAGMITGGIETVRTGDIGKGFLAGLGAYGGANLAGNLTAAGAQQGVQAAGIAGQDLMNQAITNPALAVTETGAGAGLLQSGAPATTVGDIYANSGARDALLARSAETLPASVQALPAATTPTFTSNAAQAGQGFQNMFASGDTGTAARSAFLNKAGGYTGLAQDVGMAAAPSMFAAPEYATPETKDEGSNYEGPYTPSERRVSYPTDDERRRRTSEFTYFTPSNPVPFDEGGKVEEDRSIKMPGADYKGGIDPEFSHGFKPVEVVIDKGDVAGLVPATIGGKGSMIKHIASTMSGKDKFGATDLSGYEYDPRSQRLVKGSSTGGLPALARGGSVPQLEDGGFVLTKKAVDGLGRGSNKKGQENARRGLGAIPIKGPGTGTSDSIKTTIDGKRPALVSNGEAYVPKRQVAKRGGAKAFYALMNKAEKAADKRKRA